ncbi:hypothetical protein [Microcoleus sp. herbarium12]|uniref:hypothetical protein n=1 Tax=Microcoleus sp. herbarium12 TaxID=3055437 RepID=UPI002FD239DD
MPEGERDWLTQNQVCGGKYSELSISDRPLKAALSGLAISFGKTLQYLPHKTVTRRTWKDSHAQKFVNAFHQNKLVKALDKDIHYGGKQIGWCRLLCAPYKEQLSFMPIADLAAEGGMCNSVESFINRYFKGNINLVVWVIRFEFIALAVLDIGSKSANNAGSNSAITLPSESIHQVSALGFGVYSNAAIKASSNHSAASPTWSIHQTRLSGFGVYPNFENITNSNSPISLPGESIHQTSIEHQLRSNIYPNDRNQADTNTAIIYLPADRIHQSSIDRLGVYHSAGNQRDINPPISPTDESIHQMPVVQGGSGLVYAFWQGESIVNHYRYKVKINGKWKVKSIYIPVWKLLKVKEAIANKLGVVAIVTEVLGREL